MVFRKIRLFSCLTLFQVDYGGQNVYLGTRLKLNDTKFAPKMKFEKAETDKFYTLGNNVAL